MRARSYRISPRAYASAIIRNGYNGRMQIDRDFSRKGVSVVVQGARCSLLYYSPNFELIPTAEETTFIAAN